MAGEAEVGNIVYQVQMDVSGLLQGQRQLNDRLDQVNASLNNSSRAANTTERSLFSLSKVASALAGALSVQQVIAYANAWVEVSNKLANSRRALSDAVGANESLGDVLDRVFKVSQESRGELEATATLYARLERATRSAGTSTADLAQLTSTINKAFVVSGASADEAAGAIVQLSQGLASGALRGEEFNAVSESGSRLAVALADSLGVTIGELRNMAGQGKLTTDVVVNGLLSQGDTIAKEFANTTLTMGQAFTVATNNITKFVGESSNVSTVLSVFNSGVIGLSQNLDAVAGVIAAASLIMGSRFVGALFASTTARVNDMHAAQAQAKATAAAAAATAQATKTTAIKAGLDREAALSSLALAQAEYNVARGSAAEGFALQNLNAAKSVAIQRSAEYTLAQRAQATATAAATAAAAAATTTIAKFATGALALIGGPAGAAVLAAAALFYFYQKAQQARQESIAFADTLTGVISKMKEMSTVQLAAEIDKANQSIRSQGDALLDTAKTLEANEQQQQRLLRTLSYLEEGSALYKYTLNELSQAQSEHTQLLAENERQENKLSQTISQTGILRAQANGQFRQGIELLRRDGQEAGVAAGLMQQLGQAINFASGAKERFNSSQLEVKRDPKSQQVLDDLYEQNELLAEGDKRRRAQLKVEQELRATGADDNTIRIAREQAGAIYDKQQAEAAMKKEASAAAKAESQAEAAEKRRTKSLQDLSNEMAVAELNNRNLRREAAQLAAVQDLGAGASSAQIAAAQDQAGKIFDIQQRMKDRKDALDADQMANATRQRNEDLAQLDRQLAAGDITFEKSQQRRAQIAADYSAKIAEASANAVVSPQQENAAKVDPVQALANENAKKLALIQQFEANKTITEQQGLMLRNAANKAYEQQRTEAMWTLWRDQSVGNEALAASFEALSGNASNALTGIITGSMSANEALASIGSTVLNSLVNAFVQMGVEWVKSSIMGAAANQTAVAATTATQVAAIGTTTAASTASAATTMTAWLPAALVASIGSFGAAAVVGGAALLASFALISGLSGKRKNGGPVSAGGMYQVGESGLPEIYQANNGRQYMIPGDNGSVISNKDMSSSAQGGGIVVYNNITNNSSSRVQTSAEMNGDTLTISTFISDMDEGGPMSQSIGRSFNTQRKANE